MTVSNIMTDSMSEKTNHGGRCVFMQKNVDKVFSDCFKKKTKTKQEKQCY